MTYDEAVKQAKATKVSSNYLRIRLDYNTCIVLPHAAAMSFLQAMQHAEHLTEIYNNPPQLQGLPSDVLPLEFLSAEQYQNIRVAMLLGVPCGDLEEMRRKAAAAEPTSP